MQVIIHDDDDNEGNDDNAGRAQRDFAGDVRLEDFLKGHLFVEPGLAHGWVGRGGLQVAGVRLHRWHTRLAVQDSQVLRAWTRPRRRQSCHSWYSAAFAMSSVIPGTWYNVKLGQIPNTASHQRAATLVTVALLSLYPVQVVGANMGFLI